MHHPINKTEILFLTVTYWNGFQVFDMTNPFQPIEVYQNREKPKRKKNTQQTQKNPSILAKILPVPEDQSRASEKTRGKFPILVEVFENC